MIVMICTRSRGGMRSVVEAYRNAGLFERRNVCLLDTHDEGSLLLRLSLAARALLKFFRLLVLGKVTLLHAHISMRGSFWRKTLFIMLARLFKVPVVAHLHGSDFERFVTEQPRWRKKFIVSQLEQMNTVLVLGERWRQYIISIAPATHIQVLPNSVRMPEAEANHLDRPTIEFLFLGIVGRRKGVFELIEALSIAAVRNPSIRLTIAGNGDVAGAQKMALKLGANHLITFAGWVDGVAKRRLLQESDVYVLPSHNEGLPVSILEAMSWKLPVVSTDVGSIAELVRDNIDGLIVRPGDVTALAAAMIKLADSSRMRKSMGASGKSRVASSYSEDTVMPKLEAIYDVLENPLRKN